MPIINGKRYNFSKYIIKSPHREQPPNTRCTYVKSHSMSESSVMMPADEFNRLGEFVSMKMLDERTVKVYEDPDNGSRHIRSGTSKTKRYMAHRDMSFPVAKAELEITKRGRKYVILEVTK